MGTEARLQWVENRGEKMDTTSRKASSVKPGFEGTRELEVKEAQVRFIVV